MGGRIGRKEGEGKVLSPQESRDVNPKVVQGRGSSAQRARARARLKLRVRDLEAERRRGIVA